MKREHDVLAETLRGLQQVVLADAYASRDSSLAPAPSDLGELLLAELRARRERLKRLIRLINEEARLEEGSARASRPHHRCRRTGSGPFSSVHPIS